MAASIERRSGYYNRVEVNTGVRASAVIDARIAALADWRGDMLARLRPGTREGDPDVVEE